MKTRILIHYTSGKTYTGKWDESQDFKNVCKSQISSLQIQEEGGKNHTLSLKRKQLNAFWQRDTRNKDKLISRSILRKLSKNIWLELQLDCTEGIRTVTIIKEEIKVK